jgi:hypothetical protein
MRYRLMASFRGAAYQAGVGPSDEEVTLFAACPPPEELGFRSSAGHWRRRVSVEEIDALWESRPVGRYRGERCMVLDDLGDRMHIAYLGRDLYMARRLGFWEVDRGVFEVVVPRQEIDDLREERSEYELAVVGPDDGDPMDQYPRDRDPRDWDAGGAARYAPGPRDTGPRDTGPGARPRDPMERGLMERGLMDTGPSRAADPRIMRDAAWADGDEAWTDRGADGWADRDASAQDPRDTGTWAAIRDADFREAPEPGGPYPRGRGGWRVRDTGGWERPDTGTWDARDVADMAAREAAREAAAREAAARNGANLADTGAWDPRDMADTGGWDAREINGRTTRQPSDTAPWDVRDMAGTGGRDAREVNGRSTRDTRDPADTGAWDAHDMADTGNWDAREVNGRTSPPADTGGWDAREMNGRTSRGPADTGGWDAREVNGRTSRDTRDPAGTGGWDGRQMGDTGEWSAREVADTGGWQAGEISGRDTRDTRGPADTGGWDAREVAAANRQQIARWDPQETVVWDPVNAGEWDQPARPRGAGAPDARPAPGWQPAETVPLQPRTPDAAAVWHGSPAPEDAGLWSPPEPVNMPATPPRLAIAGAPAPVSAPESRPGSRPEPAHDSRLESAYRAETAYGAPPAPAAPARDGAAWPDVVRPHPDAHVATATPIADPVMARNSATPSEYAAIAGRSVGRRSARKSRVTTQAIFSQLLDLASIPQSAYAVDDEVDGAMCLIRAKGGYEVFSLADQSRHEVRFFDDEEAAYFYLFGILAAEAVRSGYLGPKAPSAQRNADSPGGNPPPLA